jgi:hypothetical protein
MKLQLTALSVAALSLVGAAQSGTGGSPSFSFTRHDVATELTGAYQAITADINKDGKPDIIALATRLPELAWYENPTWTRHVLASGFTRLINAAAADLDGDLIPEIAVSASFATRPAESEGLVFLLTHGADVRAPWSSREIDRAPTTHRLRWLAAGGGEQWLINAPLVGEKSQRPDDKVPTPIYYYRPPDWKRQLVTDAEQGVVHGLEPATWDGTPGQVVLSAGFMGIHRYRFSGGQWQRTEVTAGDPAPWPKSGSSEVKVGHLGKEQFVVAIEPWHGNQVVIYRDRQGTLDRQVVDSGLTNGHTLVAVDLDGDGRDEVIAGETQGKRAAWIYAATGDTWSRSALDAETATSSCAASDLNGDGRIDLVCIGGTTLRWYENTSARRP